MALGFSGSNGGIGNIYQKFTLIDIESGILKYEKLNEQFENKEPREFFGKIIEQLKDLKQKMINL